MKGKRYFFSCVASLLCYYKETTTVIKQDQPKTHGQPTDLEVEWKYNQQEKSKLPKLCTKHQERRGKRIRVNDEGRYSHSTETEVAVKIKTATGLQEKTSLEKGHMEPGRD